MKTIQENQAAFDAQRDELLKTHHGEFVLFYDAQLVEMFPSFEEAFDAGCERYGLDSVFLIDQVIVPRRFFIYSPRWW